MSTTQYTNKPPVQKDMQRKPNETGSINVQAFLRIFDPNTKKIIVEKRG
jgi:hypothetical protein